MRSPGRLIHEPFGGRDPEIQEGKGERGGGRGNAQEASGMLFSLFLDIVPHSHRETQGRRRSREQVLVRRLFFLHLGCCSCSFSILRSFRYLRCGKIEKRGWLTWPPRLLLLLLLLNKTACISNNLLLGHMNSQPASYPRPSRIPHSLAPLPKPKPPPLPFRHRLVFQSWRDGV